MKKVFLLGAIVLMAVSSLHAQWLAANRAQSQDVKANGYLLVSNGTMYLWNEENHFQISTDNGATWSDPPDEIGGANPHVKKMVEAAGRVYASLNFGTGNGVVIYSTDKGTSWIADTTGAPGHALGWDGMPAVSDIYCWGHWLYVKWDRPVAYSLKAFDGSYDFNTFVNQGINNPYSVIAKGDTLFFAGAKIYYTIDGGANFVTPANNGYSGYGGKLFVDGSRLYMFAYKEFGKPCYLYYSDDNAENWTEVDVSTLTSKKTVNGDPYFPITYFIKGNRIEFVAGQEKFNSPGNVWKSNDLGTTWEADTAGLPTTFFDGVSSLAYTPDGYLWAVPDHNNIYKQKISEGGSNVVAITPSTPLRIFNNPTRGSVTIGNAAGELTEIQIFDQLGRTVKTKKIDPAMREISIDINDLVSASYMVKARAGDTTITAKLVVE